MPIARVSTVLDTGHIAWLRYIEDEPLMGAKPTTMSFQTLWPVLLQHFIIKRLRKMAIGKSHILLGTT